jgi:ketosteroid isomerase-like protein
MRREGWVMKLYCSLILVAAVVVGLPAKSDRPQKSEVIGKIVALENKYTDAYKRRDVGAMSSMLADDFIITVEDGNTYSKSGYIAHSGDTSTEVETAEMLELHVRVHGNVAIATGAYHEKGRSKGKPYEYHDRFTDTWMDLDGKWLVVASHYSVPVK